MIGRTFKGKMNDAVFEVVEIKKESSGREYIHLLEIKTKKKFQIEKGNFSKMLLEEIGIDG